MAATGWRAVGRKARDGAPGDVRGGESGRRSAAWPRAGGELSRWRRWAERGARQVELVADSSGGGRAR